MAITKKKLKPGIGGTQLPLFSPATHWTPPPMDTLPGWKGAKRICVDVETRDDNLRELGIGVRRNGSIHPKSGVSGNYVTGYSFTIEGGPSHYLPIRHEGGDNLPEEQVLEYLRTQAATFNGDVVGANLSYDLDWLWENGIQFGPDAMMRDVQIADPLIYELHMNYSLKHIGERYGIAAKNEDLLREAANIYGVDPKAGMWKLPARFVGAYAETDTQAPLEILNRQEAKIKDMGIQRVWDLESRVLPVLVKMRRRGVLIDQDQLAKVIEWSMMEETKALALVHRETGHLIKLGDVHRAEAFAPALRHLGMVIPTTETGKDSVDKVFLSSLNHPVLKALAHARKVNKLRTTFAASIERYMVNGRIHCTFNQIARETDAGDGMKGARYGRLSAVDPNLQQQPARDEFATMWRSIYIPEPGAQWACCDYSQQEPRWTTHWAAISPLKDRDVAQAAAKAYHDDPKLDNHDFMAQLTGLPRKFAKNVYLGLCYGEGGPKLCEDMGLPTRWSIKALRSGEVRYFDNHEDALDAMQRIPGQLRLSKTAGEEGQNIVNKFNERAPFILQLAKMASDRATRTGKIVTALGRVLHFPLGERGVYEFTHKALNRLIQGSSADQTKQAMVDIDREMPDTFLQLQVHDEMDGSVSGETEAKRMAELMRESIPGTKVPFRVDIEMGPSWGQLKGIE